MVKKHPYIAVIAAFIAGGLADAYSEALWYDVVLPVWSALASGIQGLV